MAKSFGLMVNGISNGIKTFTSSKGQVYHQLLVMVPGSDGIIKISLNSQPSSDLYPVGKDVEVPCLPRFYNGNVSGFDAL